MSKITVKWTVCILILLTVAAAFPSQAGNSFSIPQGGAAYRAEPAQKDSAGRARFSSVDEMARRVDSLQFIVVYNGELLRQDLSSKVIWIYVMLGVMIVASMMMYGALNQAQRQRKDLEARIVNTVTNAIPELEAKIKLLQSSLDAQTTKRPAAIRKKKKS